MRYLTFLAGAEGLEPSARGFGVDEETAHRERGRAGVAQFGAGLVLRGNLAGRNGRKATKLSTIKSQRAS